jgi:tRNA dimethylallyltransferase
MKSYNLLTILGTTASGKTQLAAHLAARLNGEVISADSRQVYRGMDIGTGKDMADYVVNGQTVPVHLIDLVDAGYQYNVFEYQRDFLEVFNSMQQRKKFPVLCGGSGLYLEAVLDNYRLIRVPVNDALRQELEGKSLEELTEILAGYKSKLHNITDIETEKRAVRAIEIEQFYAENKEIDTQMPPLNSLVVGVKFDRLSRRKRITKRLHDRLDEGMVEEVRCLLDSGLTPDDLLYYGLEYKYITNYLTGDLTYEKMVDKLNTAIHQFAKRQMTWFRRMERQGTQIHWLDGYQPLEEKMERVMELLGNGSVSQLS